MFGDNDNQQTDQNPGAPAPQTDDQNQGVTPVTPTDPAASPMAGFTPPPANDAPAPDASATDAQADTANIELPGASSLPGNLTSAGPIEDASAAPAPATGAPATPSGDGGGLTASPNDLLRIKQEALQNLTPLVDHLEQTPEERFRTTMMMIQATDDSSMIESAYEAAQQITDEKVKAQALLDVVNEINYFSQQQNGQEQQNQAA